jgi:hypothetical protein
MSKFRKKPVVIEAMQWDGSIANADEIEMWSGGKTTCRGFGMDRAPSTKPVQIGIYIETREGYIRADAGDWIIKGVNGEFYPCKPDIFAKTYEPE